MAKTKWKVHDFYATYSEKIVEAETKEEARYLADCIGWNEDQVLDKCEWTGSDVEPADDDDELTEITGDDRQIIERYREHQREQGGASDVAV